jgi:hypothetical protein
LHSLFEIIEHHKLEVCLLGIQFPWIKKRRHVRPKLAVLSTTQSFVLTVELFEYLHMFVKRFLRIWIGLLLWVDDTMGIEDIMLEKTAPKLANELNCCTCNMQANAKITEEIG